MRMKKNWLTMAWIFVVAFILLMICSRSSFLYPCNDWNDANSYFTMGKGLMNGQILYRDLYDQKGPYLYLLYGIAYLISGTTFLGVFVFEVIAVGSFLFFCYKIMCLYCTEKIALLLLPVMGAVMLASKSFYWGGAAEEFCLPLLSFGLYCSMRYLKEQRASSPALSMILVNGLMAGIVMQIKYTMLGFYFAWMAMMVLAFLLRKDWKGMLKGCLLFLAAMVLTMVPWLIYLGANHALDDWYQCYIYNNIFLYSNLVEADTGLGGRLYTLAKLLLWITVDNLAYFLFIGIGMLYFLFSFRTIWLEKINLLFLAGFLFLGIYFGGSNLPYYAIPLMIFTVLGFIPIGQALGRIIGGTGQGIALLFLTLAVSAGGAYAGSMNSYFMQQSQEDYFLYRFKAMMEQEEAPTLVTIGCLDAGLYTVADILPSCRFFQTNGIGFGKMFEEQERYVKEGKTQFVLVRDTIPEGIDMWYELVAEEPYEWDGQQFTYYLFKRRE